MGSLLIKPVDDVYSSMGDSKCSRCSYIYSLDLAACPICKNQNRFAFRHELHEDIKGLSVVKRGELELVRVSSEIGFVKYLMELYSNAEFKYFRIGGDGQLICIGTIFLDEMEADHIGCYDEIESYDDGRFYIETVHGTFILKAPNKNDKEEWIEAILRNNKNYKEIQNKVSNFNLYKEAKSYQEKENDIIEIDDNKQSNHDKPTKKDKAVQTINCEEKVDDNNDSKMVLTSIDNILSNKDKTICQEWLFYGHCIDASCVAIHGLNGLECIPLDQYILFNKNKYKIMITSPETPIKVYGKATDVQLIEFIFLHKKLLLTQDNNGKYIFVSNNAASSIWDKLSVHTSKWNTERKRWSALEEVFKENKSTKYGITQDLSLKEYIYTTNKSNVDFLL